MLGISELEGYEDGLNERGIYALELFADCLVINSLLLAFSYDL